ncbi:MAG: DUF4440 domain-containing protein [Oxalobacteraceae bacterium]|nr:MAG: DUF4440 domain-containing protein [Oxalobacteraceae bacterium]
MEPSLVVPQALTPVLAELMRLEPLFHSAHFDSSTENFQRLVAPEFWEVGASGKRYGRDFVLSVLADRSNGPEVTSWKTADFHVAEVGQDNYLLTYTLTQPDRVTRRASIWRRTSQGWQVIYHQGTVVQSHV